MPQVKGNSLIARNTAFLCVRMVVVLCVSVYSSRVVLKNLGVVDYGIYNVVAGFVALFSFLNSSFNASIQRFYNYEKGENGGNGITCVYNTALIIQLLLAILVFILSESLGLWYVKEKMVIPSDRFTSALITYHLSILQLLLIIMQVPFSSAIIAEEKMDFYAWMSIFDVFGRLIIIFMLPVIHFDKLIMYAILSTSITIIISIIYVIYAKSTVKQLKIRLNFDKGMFKSMLSFSGWNILGAFSVTLRNQGVNVILNLFFGPAVNAARAVSYQIQTAILGFANNITTAARPQLVESYASGNVERSKNIMFSITKICFIVLFVMILPICLDIDFILHIWLGDVVPEYSNIFSKIVLITALVDITNAPVSMIVLASGKVANFNIISSLIGILLLPFSYVVLHNGASPTSVFILSLLISLAIQVVSLYIMHIITGINLYEYVKNVVSPIIKIVMVSAIPPFMVNAFMDMSFVRLIVEVVLSFMSVLITTYFLGINKKERKIVIDFVGSHIKK